MWFQALQALGLLRLLQVSFCHWDLDPLACDSWCWPMTYRGQEHCPANFQYWKFPKMGEPKLSSLSDWSFDVICKLENHNNHLRKQVFFGVQNVGHRTAWTIARPARHRWSRCQDGKGQATLIPEEMGWWLGWSSQAGFVDGSLNHRKSISKSQEITGPAFWHPMSLDFCEFWERVNRML